MPPIVGPDPPVEHPTGTGPLNEPSAVNEVTRRRVENRDEADTAVGDPFG